MMSDFVDLLKTVFNFIAVKVLQIQISGITLLGWLIALIIITAVVLFVFNQAKQAKAPKEIRRRKKEDE